jgi:hypothetical protein
METMKFPISNHVGPLRMYKVVRSRRSPGAELTAPLTGSPDGSPTEKIVSKTLICSFAVCKPI